MGDRTFSANDVIRIFEDFLTTNEQGTVDFFFQQRLENVDFSTLVRVADLLLGLVSVLTTPLVGLVLSVLPQATIDAYEQAISELFRVNRALGPVVRGLDA